MEEIIKPTYKKIPYIHGWDLENFPFIEDDFDMITTYQFMCKLVQYVNELIKNSKLTEETVLGLYNYVIDYFNNLDVQEEINTKLDEMAESGELEEIISSYIQSNAVISYRTLADLVASQNLFNGMTVETMGNTTYLDGGGRKYLIRKIINTDIVDGVNIVALTNFVDLIAELIPVDLYQDIKNINDNIDNIEDNIDNIEEDIVDINDEIDKMKAKKRMLLFGDSWSMPNYPYVEDQTVCWYNKVANYLNANLNNYAVSGAGFLINNKSILSQVNEAIATEIEPEKVDYIFVEGGYNDLNFTNNVSYSDIINTVKTVFNTITSTFINAKVYFLADNTPYKLLKTETGTQTQLYNTYGFYQYFQSAIVECDSTNITVINMIPFLLGMTDTVQETLHPNTKGMHVLSKSIIDSLKGNYTRQTIADTTATYTATVAIAGSPNITNSKNIINQDFMEVTFTLYQDTAYNMQLQYGYWLDELPTIYLPNNISVVSNDGKHTINANLTVDGGRNKMILTLPNNTAGYFDITLRIPLR